MHTTETNRQKLLKEAEKYLAKADHSFAYFDEDHVPVFVKGEGIYLYDADGRQYYDMAAGYSALNQGHRHPKIVARMLKQANTLTLTNGTLTDVKIELAKKLVELVPIPNALVHFDLGGAKAVEGAKILARAFTNKRKFLSFKFGFHGRTTGALSVYDADSYANLYAAPRDYYQVPYPYCHRCPYGKNPATCSLECLADVEKTLDEHPDIGAVIVEPALGSRGYIFPPDSFFTGLRKITKERGVLLIDDEIQMGLGRMGYMFAAQRYGIEPDIILLSKSLAGGMWPLSAIIGRRDIMAKVPPKTLGSTFSGAPLAMAAGLAALEVLQEERLCERSRRLGDYFLQRLREELGRFECVGFIDGRGLALGIEFEYPDGSPNADAAEVFLHRALEHGVLMQRGGPYKNIVNLIPPLIISRREIDEVVSILSRTLADMEEGRQSFMTKENPSAKDSSSDSLEP